MIRHARTADHAQIRAVLDAAFGRGHEGDIVEHLRADGDVIFELVEEEDGAITGHVVFSRLWADSVNLYAALGPVSVRPDAQNNGSGDRLVRVGLENAKEFGAHAVVVLGHPSYYPRFGFTAQAAAQVSCPYSGLPAFMALEIEPGALGAPLTVAYPDAFGG
ncbi:MAG TPA: N-acetyltransferase [Phenylobacterium sp.]|nr:N-acetyltransferase [Phenylobacterium sp.]